MTHSFGIKTKPQTMCRSLPLPAWDTFQDPQWMPETAGSTEPYMYYVFFLYLYTYDKVVCKLVTVTD